MAIQVPIGALDIQITAERLTQETFSSFGDVISNPRPDVHPSSFDAHASSLPPNAFSANQGSAIQYRNVSRLKNLYDQAPSGKGEPIMSIFVSAARGSADSSGENTFAVRHLERHPFTAQTFTPIKSTASTYLVIVAPSLPPSAQDQELPVPAGKGLPGRGFPDLKRLRAFIATDSQAVTYGAGTWHSPMVVLGQIGTKMDFVVSQFASGIAIEDCQLLEFVSGSRAEPLIRVKIPHRDCTMYSTDVKNKLEDLSGIVLKPGENPYEAFIQACNNKPEEIQALYHAHRTKRNGLQKEKFLSSDYKELVIDQCLLRLENPNIEPGFRDERNCLVIWARPPNHIIELAAKVQGLLQQASPKIWLMPTHRMHMTTLEITFSKTPMEIDSLVSVIRPAASSIASYTHTHRSRLVKPMISYDLSAFALSFLPASGEVTLSPAPVAPDTPANGPVTQGDDYTYHHLRRDIFDKVKEVGVEVGSRYQVPSAHITLGRHMTDEEHDSPEKREKWVRAIDDINAWLENEVWDQQDAQFIGEWIVGQEKGLDVRNGALWYGGGRTIVLGEGF
ncbi:ureidoglycolate hydrolase [Trichoderma barbatum]